jgi:uncharacterized coiled-coil protein SlyX
MRTSRQRRPPRRPPPRGCALDAIGLAVALGFLPELAAARVGAVLEPHPGWIAVLVLAARYGSKGFFSGLIATALAVGIGSLVAGAGIASSWSRLDSGPNLIAFGASLAVSWVASWHLRHQADLDERVSALSDRTAEADATIEALRRVAETLRVRVDRTSTSLSFLRDVAAGLDGTDPVAAAGGAADLALARTGASASAVEVGMGGFQRLVAIRDARGPKALSSLALRDADLMVPIQIGNDRVGAIALWGTPSSGLDDAAAYDLAVIASWCAPALAVAERRPDEAAGRARRVG